MTQILPWPVSHCSASSWQRSKVPKFLLQWMMSPRFSPARVPPSASGFTPFPRAFPEHILPMFHQV